LSAGLASGRIESLKGAEHKMKTPDKAEGGLILAGCVLGLVLGKLFL
jgi:hypothetical protein